MEGKNIFNFSKTKKTNLHSRVVTGGRHIVSVSVDYRGLNFLSDKASSTLNKVSQIFLGQNDVNLFHNDNNLTLQLTNANFKFRRGQFPTMSRIYWWINKRFGNIQRETTQ